MTGGKGLGEIGERAFQNCKSLYEIRTHPGVKEIKDYTFSGCTQLTAVNGDEGLVEIGEWAFDFCESLQEIQYNLPSG